MSLRFNLTERQTFSLMAAFAVVGVMVFGTGVLYGVRWADRDDSSRAADPNGASSVRAGDGGDGGAGGAGSDNNGEPRAIYEIQLSSHLHRTDTEPVVDSLLAAGYETFVVETRDSGDRTLYTVRIGPWNSILEAADAADSFQGGGLRGFDPKIRQRSEPFTAPLRSSFPDGA